jgi:hypothetical protein
MRRDNMLFGEGYYSGNPSDISKEHGGEIERELESLLLKQDPNIKLRIEKAAKKYKTKIQASLRNETALRLSTSSGNAMVKVKVVPGLPVIVKKRLVRPIPPLPRIFVDKTSLLNAKTGLEYLEKSLEPLNRLVTDPHLAPDEIRKALDYVRKLLRLFNDPKPGDDIVEFMVKIDQDVLGAYFFHHAEIHLYWLVIGLFSYKYGVSPESMTAVVAAHEWAHAYTHLGADAGGKRWDTDAFASCSLITVESLAQYYGGLACERLSKDCFDAYLKLLARQPHSYRFHLGWFTDNPNEQKTAPAEDLDRWGKISNPEFREAVRFALLEARSGDWRCPQNFVGTLQEVCDRLKLDKQGSQTV